MSEYLKVSEEKLAELSDDELAQLAKERMTTVSDIQNYEIVILTSEVVSVNYFDLKLYDEQFKPKEEQSTTNRTDEEWPKN